MEHGIQRVQSPLLPTFFPIYLIYLRVVASDMSVFLTSEYPRWLDQFEACVKGEG